METARYDRTAEDVGNLVHLEHVNLTQPDQGLSTLFYVVGLGGTRDPYLMVGLENMWVNYGRTQLHLPTSATQRLRGTMGFVVPSLAELKARFAHLSRQLKGTFFSFSASDACVEAVCPWGNRLRCHAPSPQFGSTQLGLVYVDFDVPRGAAAGIARFYSEVMRSPAQCAGERASVPVGRSQYLYFTETAAPPAEYDGHHIQVYIADFSRPYQWLHERGLITLEADAHEWRFQSVVDPGTGERLFEIEHEVRSLKHPLYARPLVNRNPQQTSTQYLPRQDDFRGTY
jgi:hypothetical protein